MSPSRRLAAALAATACLLAAPLRAQGWGYLFGDGWLAGAEPTPDGGFIAVGTSLASTGPGGNTAGDGLLVKLSSAGSIEWSVAAGWTAQDDFTGVAVLPDGYLATGEMQIGATFHLVAVALDFSGNLLWQRDYGAFAGSAPHPVVASTDGNYFVAGVRDEGGQRLSTVLKLRSDGSVAWHRGVVRGQSGLCCVLPIAATAGGGVVLATPDLPAGNLGALVAFDADGGMGWMRDYGSAPDRFSVTGLTSLADGSLVMTGSVETPPDATTIDQWVVRTDAQGVPTWQARFGVTGVEDRAGAVAGTTDGGLVVAGSNPGGLRTLAKLDASGGLVSAHDASLLPMFSLTALPSGLIGTGDINGRMALALLDEQGLPSAPCMAASVAPLAMGTPPSGSVTASLSERTLLTVADDGILGIGFMPLGVDCAGLACRPLACGAIVLTPPDPCLGDPVNLELQVFGGEGPVSVTWDLDGDASPDAAGNPIDTVMPASTWRVAARAVDSCPSGAQSCTRMMSVIAPGPLGEVSDVLAGAPPLLVPSTTEVIVESLAGATAYDMYVGVIGSWYHSEALTGRRCAEGSWIDHGDGTLSLADPFPIAGSYWILVTAANPCFEGAAGTDSFRRPHEPHPTWEACGPAP